MAGLRLPGALVSAGSLAAVLAVGAFPAAESWGGTPAVGSAAGFAEQSLPVQVDTLHVEPGERVVCLHGRFVFAAELVVREGERRLRPGSDYVLDADAGCLTLLGRDSTGVGRTLTASYRSLPVAVSGVYRLREDPHRRKAGRAPEGEASPRPVPFQDEGGGSGLLVSGSKTIGIEIGNRRDLKLQQSLDLRLTGRVSRDVSLLAILSDQDVPFQPEGSTAELDELDKVLVQIESPHARASLGDVDLAVNGFEFLRLRRKMEGFSARGETGTGRAVGAVASAKGEYATRTFFGVDGKQGPYRLTDRADSAGVVVVAGSERVWFDGELLQRGEEEDYVMDYSLGEITFTSRRVVTANSEITVDYQFATSRYRRRLAYAGAQAALPRGAGTLAAAVFTEGDDAGNPFGGDLSDAERAELSVVGDSARVSGGTRFVGSGEEDYDLVVDPESGREIFVYVAGTGDYAVSFVNVGEGHGAYDPDPNVSGARIAYRFVGDGKGSYVPRRGLPAPERKRLADLRWDLAGGRGRLAVEGALSDADGNTLSPRDDEDNRGGAFFARGRLEPVTLGGGLRVAPRFLVRRVGERFRSPSRFRPGFYGREWNLGGTGEIRDETLAEGSVELRWFDRLLVRSQVGRLALADTFAAVRQRHEATWRDGWVHADASWTRADDTVHGNDGNLDRASGAVTLRRWRIWPQWSGLHETRRRASGEGERHRQWRAGLVLPPERWPFRVEVGVGRRLDDSLGVGNGSWRGALDTRTGFATVDGRAGDLSFLLRYEMRRVRTEGSGEARRDVGRVDLRHRALRGAWTAVLTMDVGTAGLRRRSKSIVPADPPASGYYDRFGNYVGPGGGYDVVYGAREEETLTGQVDLNARVRWFPPESEASVPRWLRRVAWEGFVTLAEASTLPLVTPRHFLSPGSYLNRDHTLNGRLRARQTLDLFPRHRTLGVRLREETTRRVSRSAATGTGGLVEIEGEDRLAVVLRSAPGRGWDTELEGSAGRRREEVDPGSGDGLNQTTNLRALAVRGGRRTRLAGGDGRVSMEASYTEETGADRRATGWIVRPQLRWARRGAGRVDLRSAWTRLTSRRGFVGLRGPGAPRLTEGWRLDLVGELRVKKGVAVTAGLGFDYPRGLAPVRRGRVEVRGSF